MNWWRRRKAAKQEMIVARGLLELHYMAVTVHGRQQLRYICDNSDGVIPDIVLGMYEFFLAHAPISDWAEQN